MNTNPVGKIKFARKPAKSKKKPRKSNCLPNFIEFQRQQICELAARIIHEDGIRDYHKAKLRACETLHLKSNTFLPTNEEIELTLQQRLSLFSTNQSDHFDNSQINVSKDMLEVLMDFQARLTGNLVNGISLEKAPVEIHVFSSSAELIIDELNWRGIANHLIEKRYRYNNNEYAHVPLVICQLDQHDIEISVFKEKELHRSPVCPTNGRTYKRLSLKQLTRPGLP